jgi:hypothetical protein
VLGAGWRNDACSMDRAFLVSVVADVDATESIKISQNGGAVDSGRGKGTLA